MAFAMGYFLAPLPGLGSAKNRETTVLSIFTIFKKCVLQVFSWVVTVFVLPAGSSGCLSATAGPVPARPTMFITSGMADGRTLSGPTAQAFA
jgi:hypothetical protein